MKFKKIELSKNKNIIALDLYPVYSDELYWGHEPFKVVGIRENEVEIQGDFSGGTHNVSQKDWIGVDKLFVVSTICEQTLNPKGCQIHNVNCCGGGNIISKHEQYWKELI